METATVVRLKSQLSRYLRRVKAGEEVIVTERGVPIARLVPVGKRTSDLDDLRDLERQGISALASRSPEPRWSGRSSRRIRRSWCGREHGLSASLP